jgi:hypothetical protein
MRKALVFLILLAALGWTAMASAGTPLEIVYSGDTHGYYRPCPS